MDVALPYCRLAHTFWSVPVVGEPAHGIQSTMTSDKHIAIHQERRSCWIPIARATQWQHGATIAGGENA